MAEKFRMVCLLSLAALTLAGSSAQAQIHSRGELDFFVEPTPAGNFSHGYTEYRVFVTNKGKEETYRVTLTIPAENESRGGNGATLQSITRSVSVGPGLTSVVSLYQPSAPYVPGTGIAIRINGRSGKLPFTPVSSGRMGGMGHHYGYSRRGRMYFSHGGPSSAQPLVLRSLNVDPQFNVDKRWAGIPGAGGGKAGLPGVPGMGGGMAMGVAYNFNGEVVPALSPISTWSSHWLGYTRYDGIVVTRDDIKELQSGGNDTRAVLQALWQYTEAGGVLIILGAGDVPMPESWKRNAFRRDSLISPMTIYPVGFGQCLIAKDPNSKNWAPPGRPDDPWGMIGSAVNTTTMPWQSSKALAELNKSFPVVDDLGVPVKGLFVLMILFAIALGPVNLIVLGRKKKRIWMLWTVPAISLFTCVLVFGYMVIAEGWQGHARTGGITLLDEIDHRATSLGRATFYSPLTPGGGLHFSEETEVWVQGGDEDSSSSSCAIDWTQEQHLSRGWVTARVPAHFATRCSETRRERLNVHREADGRIGVLNGLGVEIKTLWLADEKGVLYKADSIPAGARATLDRGDKDNVPNSKSVAWRTLYATSDWINSAKTARDRPWDVLRPRTYLAVVDGSPFHNEQALPKATLRGTESVVLGIMADLGGK